MKPNRSQRMLSLAIGVLVAVGLIVSVQLLFAQTRQASTVLGPSVSAG